MSTTGAIGNRDFRDSYAKVSKAAFSQTVLAWFGAIIAGLTLCAGLQAQTLTTLHSFNGKTDGDEPDSPLLLWGGTLYGATRYGGSTGYGTVFKINTDGTEFANLYTFTDSDADGNGAGPYGPLIISGDALYGTATGIPAGTVFKVNTNGSAQSVLYAFSGGIDDEPFGGVILSGNTLYGTTSSGVVFKINTNGTDFAILHCLTCDLDGDGSTIYGGLVLVGNSLYGTTMGGGLNAAGTIFKINTDGSGFLTLHDFQETDGGGPWSGLLLYNSKLYGTTTRGGGNGSVGVVYSINPDGTGFTNLHHFTGYEGGWPQGGLICSGDTLYGTTMQGGGVGAAGTVFSLKTDGSDFKTLYVFTGGTDGGAPSTGLTLVGSSLYGTTSAGNGTIFRLSLPGAPPTAYVRSANSLVITWPTNTTSYVLQSSTDLTTWSNISRTPQLMNGQYVLTNAISGPARFFRLGR